MESFTPRSAISYSSRGVRLPETTSVRIGEASASSLRIERRLGIARQERDDAGHGIAHILGGHVDIAIQTEGDRDDRQRLGGGRTDVVDAFDRATASSMRRVTVLSISSGEAPSRVVRTLMIGRSTSGNRSTPRRPYATAPTTTMARISMTAKTGRWTQTSASFCIYRTTTFCPLVIRPSGLSTTSRPGSRPETISTVFAVERPAQS